MFVPRSPRVPCPARQWGLCHCFRITSGSSVPPVPPPLLADSQLPSAQSSVPSEGSAALAAWEPGVTHRVLATDSTSQTLQMSGIT